MDVTCDGPAELLTFDEGEDAILQVSQTQARLSNINWNFEQHIIAITRPGQPLQLEKYSYKYAGRLSSSIDGSLEISRLTATDRQIYRAEIFDENQRYLCVQLYDVITDAPAGNSPSVPFSEACSNTIQVFYSVGENITLKLPSRARIASIFWDINNIDHIVTTQPGGIIYRQNSSYNGKLSVTNDGSLRIFNLTTKDQHVYRADHFTGDWVHLCTKHYDVRVKDVTCDGPAKLLTFDEGENAILQVSRTQAQLSNINWKFEQHIIAITRPGQPLQLEKYSSKYAGRLFSSIDGSLVISRLTATDRQIYRAEIFDENQRYLCVQLYDVITDAPGGNSPSVSFSEACSNTIQVFYSVGENITLKLPSRARIASIFWDINNIDHIVTTQPGGIIYRQNSSYINKLSVTNDGSLRIFNLTTKDQHVYRADHFTGDWVHLCTKHYDVRVKEIYEEFSISYGFQKLLRLALSACILIATFSILIYHIKTESCRTPQ
ncbi:uncharacterized protein [Dendrobates tinctorius]|uniref:uncharacterized protein isoform X2 n=1 Tax=Dendrobates tinctorius TaxID=92724 RepID=UPI003CC99484